MTSFRRIIAVVSTLLVAGASLAAGPADSLIRNGSFELDAKGDGSPDGWGSPTENIRFEKEEGNRFLRLQCTESGKLVMLFRELPLKEEDKAYEFSFRVRYDNVKPGKEVWHDARILLNFKDAQGKAVSGGTAPYFRGSSQSKWVQKSVKFLKPAGATRLDFMPSLFQVASGTLDLDDLTLVAIDPESIPKAIPMESPVVAAPAPEKLPKELRVVGNQLRDPAGNSVWLQGLSVDSLQWSTSGDRIVQSIEIAIDQWKANTIRLAVMDDFWFGRGGRGQAQKDGGARYRQIIDSAVNTAAGRGAYLVIDLHRFRAPDEKTAAFWKDVATTYRNHPAVLFELFNEPHDITWEVWRNGGEVTDKVKPKEGVAVENSEQLRSFKAVGMQQLVEIVREAGARNIVIAGGLDWSYDLGGVMNGFALTDSSGNGIMYSSHVYPWKSDWQNKFIMAAEKYPLFIGEVGCIEKWEDFSFIPPEGRKEKVGPGCTWSQDMLGVIQKHKLNWTGFSFHPRCGPMVIKDWNYTPTDYWGVFVKDALAGKPFETRRLR